MLIFLEIIHKVLLLWFSIILTIDVITRIKSLKEYKKRSNEILEIKIRQKESSEEFRKTLEELKDKVI